MGSIEMYVAWKVGGGEGLQRLKALMVAGRRLKLEKKKRIEK